MISFEGTWGAVWAVILTVYIVATVMKIWGLIDAKTAYYKALAQCPHPKK